MKIGNVNNALPFATGLDPKARLPSAKHPDNKPDTAAGNSGEKIGTTSVQLRSVGSTANTPFDASKLAEIKQSISDGRIQINSSAIAESLVKSVVDLISTQ